MQILVITSDLPFPPIWGAAIRNYQFLKGLAGRHSIWLLSFESPAADQAVSSIEQIGVCVRTVPWQRPAAKRLSQLKSVFSTRSHLGGIFHQPAMQVEIERLLADEDFDVVLVEGSLLARFDFGQHVPVVLDEHNVEFEILQRTYHTERSPLRKMFGFLEFRKFRHEEQTAWRQAALITFTSEREEGVMRSNGISTPSAVVPNGVDLEYLKPSSGTPDQSRVVFTGRLGYRPNTDAVLYFAREVLPLILRQRPDVIFNVVGADVPREVDRLAGPGIDVIGPVPDVRPYWRQAAVAVAPIRFGGGTRLKVVEAMAMGRPVVCTSVGCEGIAVTPGEHLLVADTPKGFAAAVLRLLEDPALADTLGRQGRALVEAEYAWSGMAVRLAAALERVVAQSRSTRLGATT